MKSSNNGVDPRALDAELHGAMAADLRHKRVDGMKKRAILTANSYEEFRQLVACAETNQKPLSRKELGYLSGDKASSIHRNGFASGRSSRKTQPFLFGEDEEKLRQGNAQRVLSKGLCPESTKSYADFDRLWRRCGSTSGKRMELLLGLDTENLGKIFHSELNELGDIVIAMKEVVVGVGVDVEVEVEVEKVVDLLAALSKVKAFDMALRFLSKEEKCALQEVFHALEDRKRGATDVITHKYAPIIQ